MKPKSKRKAEQVAEDSRICSFWNKISKNWKYKNKSRELRIVMTAQEAGVSKERVNAMLSRRSDRILRSFPETRQPFDISLGIDPISVLLSNLEKQRFGRR
jgi:hypothetical protein